MDEIKVPSDMDTFVQTFEDEYASIYTQQAKYSEAGVLCLALGLTAIVPKSKPELIKQPLSTAEPKLEARKGVRQAYFEDQFYDTTIYDFSGMEAGNVVYGPAIIEHIDTNYVIPPGHRIEIDEYMTLWLKKEVN